MCAPAASYVAANALASISQAIFLAKTIGISALIGALVLSIARVFRYKFGFYRG